jgi:hypothetical protein
MRSRDFFGVFMELGRKAMPHLVLRSKPNARSISAQEQVFTHTVKNVNTENKCLYYINFIT